MTRLEGELSAEIKRRTEMNKSTQMVRLDLFICASLLNVRFDFPLPSIYVPAVFSGLSKTSQF
jgi:hypothetical protein